MNKNRLAGMGLLLMTLLLVSMAFVSSVSAQTDSLSKNNSIDNQSLNRNIVLDADIDIYPDTYSYNKYDYGTVNVNIDNYVLPGGFSNYFLKIPDGVEYKEVYDGKEPDNVYYLGNGESTIIPEWGSVNGPATVLYWMDLHTFGYDENMKVKVKFNSIDDFEFYAGDSATEAITGATATDNDRFTVNVS
jgi:hypothetical protein